MLNKQIRKKISESHKISVLAIAARKRLHLSQIGIPKSKRVREKISNTLKGNIPWNKGKKSNRAAWNKGKSGYHIHSENFRQKISIRMKGKNNTTGKSPSLETRKKLSESHSGEKHYNWRGGITSQNMKERRSLKYRLWREAVFKRDNWTCLWCNARSKKGKSVILNADHIKPFAYYPKLRFVVNNGRTLCLSCHESTPTYGNRKEIIS